MKHIEVVAAVIIRDNKVFATQRGYGEFKDWWEFPGGKQGPVCDHRGVGLPYLSPKYALLSVQRYIGLSDTSRTRGSSLA